MAKALKCDRCGEFYDLLTNSRNYRIIFSAESYKKERFVDLCPDCYEVFTKWVTGKRFESRHYEFEDCDNIKGERVIRCREEEDGSSSS